jgi:hypothetical protein
MGVGSGGVGQKNTSEGGITPEQQTLAQYHFGQDATKNAFDFSQIPMSTNLTQKDVGARAAEAKERGTTSISDAAAMAAFENAQTSNFTGGIGSALGSLTRK